MTSFPSSASPPVTPGPIEFEAEPPSWPKVIGIISIVWGSLGVVCNACGLVGQMAGDAFVNMVPPEQREQMKAQMAQSGSVAQMAVYVVSTLLAVLLIVAGVQLLQRKPIARMLHLVYAGFASIATIVGTVVAWGAIEAQMQQMTSDPALAQQASAMKGGMYVGVAFGVLIGLAYPLFLLIWFLAIKKDANLIAQGVQRDPI